MTKGLNNHPSLSNDDYRLPRAKILRGRKNFQRLFERDAQFHRNTYVNLRFKVIENTSFGCLMAFIVKTSLGKAHKRNRTKRLLREAYRLHQHLLSDQAKKLQIMVHGALIANTVDISYPEVEQNVIALLKNTRDQLPGMVTGNS